MSFVNHAITKNYERIATTCKEISLRFDGRLNLGSICSGMGTAEMVTRCFSEMWNTRGDTPLQAGMPPNIPTGCSCGFAVSKVHVSGLASPLDDRLYM